MNRLFLMGALLPIALAAAHHTPVDVIEEKAPPPNPAREPKVVMREKAAARMAPLKDPKPKPKAKSHALKCLLKQKGRK